MKQLLGVIGDPIQHSMSPSMHNDAFEHLGINAQYYAFQVKPEDLEDAVKGMKAIGIKGFNVTVPHKTSIMPFLDAIDPLAEAIGAVNTVNCENGQYVGYNTDGLGYVTGLKEKLTAPLSAQKVLIIGAGGAARAIYFTLVKEGVSAIDVANRTLSRAEQLIKQCPYSADSKAILMEEAEKNLYQYTLIINTTSIGLSPNIDQMPLSLKHLRGDALVSDIIYNPLETKFLQEAKNKGASIQNGVPMFIHQGALAFQIWMGLQPDTERMSSIVLRKLGGIPC